MTIAFTIPGEAVPWARAGARGAQRFTPLKQRNYAGSLKMFCNAAMRGRPPLEGPVELSVVAVYAWPKAATPRKRAAPGAEWKTSRADLDNVGKMVMDALNTVAWGDDAQIASLHQWKRYGDVPSLQVRIRSLIELHTPAFQGAPGGRSSEPSGPEVPPGAGAQAPVSTGEGSQAAHEFEVQT